MTAIRKISIGPVYKDGMHYSVYGPGPNRDWRVHLIRRGDDAVRVYIINRDLEVVLWKEINNMVPMQIEYNIEV